VGWEGSWDIVLVVLINCAIVARPVPESMFVYIDSALAEKSSTFSGPH
jgi:hypothetical protein